MRMKAMSWVLSLVALSAACGTAEVDDEKYGKAPDVNTMERVEDLNALYAVRDEACLFDACVEACGLTPAWELPIATWYLDAELEEDYVYAATGYGLHIFRYDRQAGMRETSCLGLPGTTAAIAVDAGTVYALSVAHPYIPPHLAGTPDATSELQTPTRMSLHAIDVSEPSQPRWLYAMLPTDLAMAYNPRETFGHALKARNGTLALRTSRDTVTLLDVSSPDQVERLGDVTPKEGHLVEEVILSDHRLYALVDTREGTALAIYEVNPDQSPRLLGSFEQVGLQQFLKGAALAEDQDRLYVLADSERSVPRRGLWAFDISTPARISAERLETNSLEVIWSSTGIAYRKTEQGPRLLVLEKRGAEIYDVTDPLQPALLYELQKEDKVCEQGVCTTPPGNPAYHWAVHTDSDRGRVITLPRLFWMVAGTALSELSYEFVLDTGDWFKHELPAPEGLKNAVVGLSVVHSAESADSKFEARSGRISSDPGQTIFLGSVAHDGTVTLEEFDQFPNSGGGIATQSMFGPLARLDESVGARVDRYSNIRIYQLDGQGDPSAYLGRRWTDFTPSNATFFSKGPYEIAVSGHAITVLQRGELLDTEPVSGESLVDTPIVASAGISIDDYPIAEIAAGTMTRLGDTIFGLVDDHFIVAFDISSPTSPRVAQTLSPARLVEREAWVKNDGTVQGALVAVGEYLAYAHLEAGLFLLSYDPASGQFSVERHLGVDEVRPTGLTALDENHLAIADIETLHVVRIDSPERIVEIGRRRMNTSLRTSVGLESRVGNEMTSVGDYFVVAGGSALVTFGVRDCLD
jgi:hypothetical protein